MSVEQRETRHMSRDERTTRLIRDTKEVQEFIRDQIRCKDCIARDKESGTFNPKTSGLFITLNKNKSRVCACMRKDLFE